MSTIHIYDDAHPISQETARQYGPQRHIFFTTEPKITEAENCAREIRNYSKGDFKKVETLFSQMQQLETQRGNIYRIISQLENVSKYVIRREPASSADHNDSNGDPFELPISKQGLKNIVDLAAPYFTGISRVDLYAAISGRETDKQFAKQSIEARLNELKKIYDTNQQIIDLTYHTIMAVPIKTPKPTQPIAPKNKIIGFLKRLCA